VTLPTLAEKAANLERHLARVATKLPETPSALLPGTDASDAVILHMFQATQIVLDAAMASCVVLKLGTPTSYANAFERLAAANVVEAGLAQRLARAAGFRNVIAHAYETLDLARVWQAATDGPNDLRSFLRALAAHVVS
jgi:uncharacterized protein YutE (UPF0331/DUF86 family)